MAKIKSKYKTYFELSQHNYSQVITFALLTLATMTLAFLVTMPLLQKFFEQFLHGRVYNDGRSMSFSLDTLLPMNKTSFLFSWCVDIYKGTASEARFWFDPLLSLFLQSSIFGIAISVVISSLLPLKIGYMRQKIEREIVNMLDKIAVFRYGYHAEYDLEEIEEELFDADLRTLRQFAEEWQISFDDIKTLQRAIIWQNSNSLYRIIHVNDGISMYMRFYFTMQYSNTVLGCVYIGAAILIIIIGLRGLKFIPASQPSLVLFALGLEFSLLITYAMTLMYSKQDENGETEMKSAPSGGQVFLGNDFGSSKEVEKLLRVFIKKSDSTKNKGKK